MSDAIDRQNAEFTALDALITQYKRLCMTPVVDDDYPEIRHYYESALRTFVGAYNANSEQRLQMRVVNSQIPQIASHESIPQIASHESIPHISAVSLARALRWHPDGLTSWSLSDWGVALAGEVGELCNVIKKLNRQRGGLQQRKVDPLTLTAHLLTEIGDVYLYLDLLAQTVQQLYGPMGGNALAECVRTTFNRVSEREGFPERL